MSSYILLYHCLQKTESIKLVQQAECKQEHILTCSNAQKQTPISVEEILNKKGNKIYLYSIL